MTPVTFEITPSIVKTNYIDEDYIQNALNNSNNTNSNYSYNNNNNGSSNTSN